MIFKLFFSSLTGSNKLRKKIKLAGRRKNKPSQTVILHKIKEEFKLPSLVLIVETSLIDEKTYFYSHQV